jgi:hypothetical protein
MSTLNERMRTLDEVQAGENPVVTQKGGILALKIERATTVALSLGDEEVYPEGQCQALGDCVRGHWFSVGDLYVTFGGGRLHVDCLESVANKSSRLDFLLMLSTHVAAAPSNHNAGTVRQVINGLIRALAVVQRERDHAVADAYALGARETAEAIADAGGSVDLPIDVSAAIAAGEDEGA